MLKRKFHDVNRKTVDSTTLDTFGNTDPSTPFPVTR